MSGENQLAYDQDEKSNMQHVEKAESSRPASVELVKTPEEWRLVRKLDNRILPIACLMYLFACLSHLRHVLEVLLNLIIVGSLGPLEFGERASAGFAARHAAR